MSRENNKNFLKFFTKAKNLYPAGMPCRKNFSQKRRWKMRIVGTATRFVGVNHRRQFVNTADVPFYSIMC